MPRKLNTLAVVFASAVLSTPICAAQKNEPPKAGSNRGPATSSASTTSDKRGEVLATVGGQPIYEDDLLPSIASKLMPLRNQEYQIKKQALDSLIDQKLLEADANKKGFTTTKLLEQEVDSKVAEPTDAEVNAYYLAQKNQFNRPFDELRAPLKNALKQARIEQARQDYYKQLRTGSQVAVLLQAPKVEVSFDPARVRGNPKAPVMIIEFSDYQCPYCQGVEPTLKAVLAKHPNDVSLAFRDMPLKQIHPLAEGAAEAARCAGEQGKFWEYHDLIFANHKLDKDGLFESARSLKLDEKQFQSCVTTRKYKAQIEADALDGSRAGVNGTPGFFVNGTYFDGNQPEATFEKAIQDALAAQTKPPKKGN